MIIYQAGESSHKILTRFNPINPASGISVGYGVVGPYHTSKHHRRQNHDCFWLVVAGLTDLVESHAFKIYLGVMQPTELKTCSLSTAASSESLGPEFLVASMAWMEPSLQRHPWSADLQSWASQSFLPNSPRYFLQYICKLCKHVLQTAHTCKKNTCALCHLYTHFNVTYIHYICMTICTYV